MPSERFSDPDPVEEILRIAVRKHSHDDASLRQRLLASASELGISEEAALAAQKEWETRKEAEEEIAAFRRQQKGEMLSHLSAYAMVMAILVFINSLTLGSGRDWWVVWPAGLWGIILVVHALVALGQIRNPGGEEFERFRRRAKGKASRGHQMTVGTHTPRPDQGED